VDFAEKSKSSGQVGQAFELRGGVPGTIYEADFSQFLITNKPIQNQAGLLSQKLRNTKNTLRILEGARCRHKALATLLSLQIKILHNRSPCLQQS